MCIVEYFPPGVDKDTEFVKESIRQGAASNSMGLGFAFKKNGKLYLHKGFESSRVNDLIKEIESHALTKDDELVFHARIATSGGTRPEMTHPFVCSNDIEEVGILKGYVEKPVLAHNGVFPKLGNAKYSDTFEFAHQILGDSAALALLKLDQEAFSESVKDIWGWSKVVVMFPGDEKTKILGEFVTDKDCKFSNNGYKTYVRNVGGVERRDNFQGRAYAYGGRQGRIDDVDSRDGFEDEYDHSCGAGCFPSQGARIGQSRSSIQRGIHPFKLDESFVHSGMFHTWPVIYSNIALVPNIFNYDMLVGTCNNDIANFRKGEKIFLNSYDPFAGAAICNSVEDTSNILSCFEEIKDLVKNCTFVPKAVDGPFLKEYLKINDILWNIRVDNDRPLYDTDTDLPISKGKMKDIFKFVMDEATETVGGRLYLKANKSKYSLVDSPRKGSIALASIVSTAALVLWYAERQHLFPKSYQFSHTTVGWLIGKKNSFFSEFGAGFTTTGGVL